MSYRQIVQSQQTHGCKNLKADGADYTSKGVAQSVRREERPADLRRSDFCVVDDQGRIVQTSSHSNDSLGGSPVLPVSRHQLHNRALEGVLAGIRGVEEYSPGRAVSR